MLDVFLHTARASRKGKFAWKRISEIAITPLSDSASPRAIILASPHIHWDRLADGGDLVKRWATAASAVPYTEEVGQNVVDVLLQIASAAQLVPFIPVDVWSWLAKSPLPPICMGRSVRTSSRVVKAIRALKDVEVFKSYLLIVWSEWGDLRNTDGFQKV